MRKEFRATRSRVLRQALVMSCASCLLLSFLHGPLHAQDLNGLNIVITDPLVVEARRVEENILDVPASVSVIPVDRANESAGDAPTNFARRIPNYDVVDNDWPAANFGFIRGVGNLQFPVNSSDTTIGYSLDGQPLSLSGAYMQLLDVERVEVVRGPQNVLYGRGSQGGSINYVTREPDGIRDIRLLGEIGTDGTYLSDIYLGGALTDAVAGRLALRATGQGGFIWNGNLGQDLSENEIYAGRGSLRVQLGDDTTLNAAVSFERDERNSARFILRNSAGFPASGLDEEPTNDRDLMIASVELEHAFDSFDLTASAGLQDIETTSRLDTVEGLVYAALIPGFPANIPGSNVNAYDQHERVFTGEVRAASKEGAHVRWIAGLSAYSSTFDQFNTDASSLLPFQNGVSDTTLDLTTLSVFGEISVPVTSALSVTPSLRVGHDTFDFENAFTSTSPMAPVAFFRENSSRDETWWAGGLSVEYKVNEYGIIYASVKRGHASGGFPLFNGNAPFGVVQAPYPESTSITYEVGGSAAFFHDRLYVSGAAFFNDVKDGHLFDFDFVTGQFVLAPQDYESVGFELEGRLLVDEDLTLFGGIGVIDSELIVTGANVQGARPGGRVPGVPRVNLNFGIEKLWDLSAIGAHGTLTTSADMQYVGARAADIPNSFDLESYVIANARIGWQNDSLSFYAFGRNLTDELPEVSGTQFAPGIEAVVVGRGRVLGMGMEIEF